MFLSHVSGTTQVLKTLVFSAGDGADAPLVVVVLPLTARVDTRKLARALGLRRSALRLAPPAAAEAATGYACGDIPPLGHVQPLRVLLDAAALAGGPARPLYAGGGGGGASLRIPAAELLRATAAEVADVAAGRSPADVAALLSAVAAAFGPPHESLLGAYVGSRDGAASAQATAADVAEALLASEAPAVVDATVGRVRRMGRLLLFASLLQPAWHRGGDDVAGEDALQALAGRTFASAFDSEDAAAEALRSIMRPGARVRVAGRLQANPRPGCVDVVVAEMRLIATEAPAQAVPPAAVPDSVTAADAKDPDAWFLEAGGDDGGDDDADEEGEDDYDEELLDGEDDDSDTEDAMPLSNDPRGSRPRRRSARRRSAQRATELAPLRPFTLPAGVAVAYVDCAAGVASMAALLLDPASATHAPLDGVDGVALPAAVGLDSEWRPYARGEAATPVALLQLCSRRHAFLVDVQALAADSDSAGMAALGAFMRELLASPAVIKTGLGLRYDLTRLAESHASLGLGGAPARGLLELRAAAACAAPEALPWLPRPARLLMAGLASLARLALRCELDKGAQVSDWAARPLNETQRAYAAADAAVLLALFDSLLRRSAALRSRLPALLDAPPAGLPRRGRQDDLASRRELRARGSSSSSSRGDKLSPQAVQIDAEPLLRAFLGAPLPAKGRDAALAAAAAAGAGGRARGAGGCRGGVLECANATLLFMNAEPVFGKRYPNTFWRRGSYSGDSDDALMMSWFGNPGQSRDAPQVARLRAADATVLLFARLPRGPYVLCGRLACEGTSEDGDDGDDPALPPAPTGLLRLSMRLLDAGPLCGSAHFAALLQHAQGDAGLALLRR